MADLLKFTRTTLTGGGATAVDGISATTLTGNEICWANVGNVTYQYQLNATSGAAADGINIIIPVVGTVGNKRWILQVSPIQSGGTGRATSTTAYGLIAAGTTATGAQQTLPVGLTTEIPVGGGAAALPVWTTATGSGAPVRAVSPTLTGTPLAPTAADNTSTTHIATTAFAKAEDAMVVNPKATSQAVALTAAASGSSGITVADNVNINPATSNFIIGRKLILPIWTAPAAAQIIYQKEDGSAYGYRLQLLTTGKLHLYCNVGYINVQSNVAVDYVDNTSHDILAVVVRETTSVAGSVTFYGDGIQIGSGLPFRLICRSPLRFAYKMGIQSEVDNLVYHYGSDVINERIENIKACYEKEIKRPGVLKYKPSIFLDIYLKKITNKE